MPCPGNRLMAGYGITVEAAVRTGVIRSDIAAFHAAACLALALIFSHALQSSSSDALHQLPVDTSAVPDTGT